MKLVVAYYDSMKELSELASGSSSVHQLHPSVKLFCLLLYLILLLSLPHSAVQKIVLLASVPAFTLTAAGVPWRFTLKRALLVLPLVLFIGLSNLLFTVGGETRAWLSFIGLALQSIIAVSMVTAYVATTQPEQILATCQTLHLPQIVVVQFMLCTRYLGVLLGEASKMQTSYLLRSGKGISVRDIGQFLGLLLLRAVRRAERVHASMLLRGWKPQASATTLAPWRAKDYLVLCASIGGMCALRFL